MFEQNDTCSICGGDGRIGNTFGATKTCPGCMGSGRRAEDTGFRDVTKTKGPGGSSTTDKSGKSTGAAVGLSAEGAKLAREVRDHAGLSDAAKVSLIGEIAKYEEEHGGCTSTFQKKVRKRLKGG